jgi:hypothetical protein
LSGFFSSISARMKSLARSLWCDESTWDMPEITNWVRLVLGWSSKRLSMYPLPNKLAEQWCWGEKKDLRFF